MLCVVVSFFMYTYYIRCEGDTHSRHINMLYADFNRVCDAMDEDIQRLCTDFEPPNRNDIMAMIETRKKALYFVSKETGDKFILYDLPVIE